MDLTGTPEVAQGASRQSSSSTFQLHSQIATEKETWQEKTLEPTLECQAQIDVYKMFISFFMILFILFYNHNGNIQWNPQYSGV